MTTTMDTFEQQVRDGVGAVAGVDSRGDRHEMTCEFPLETRDSYGTAFLPDTFRRSLAERKPAFVWQHSLREPIGRCLSAGITNQNHRGERRPVIQVRNQFSRFGVVPLAERAYTQLMDGDLDGDVSFGFTELAPPQPWRSADGIRAMAIPLARMNETSIVTRGAIPGAVVTGIRDIGGLRTGQMQSGRRPMAASPEMEEVERIFERRLGVSIDGWRP